MNELVDIRENCSLLLILWYNRNRATIDFLTFPIWYYGNLWKGAGEQFPAVNGWHILPDKADHRCSACILRQCHSEPNTRIFLLCELDAGLKQLAGDTQSPASLWWLQTQSPASDDFFLVSTAGARFEPEAGHNFSLGWEAEKHLSKGKGLFSFS